ncbi:MAG: tail fiber domain-containing protein [Chitinophagaceae bacterium]
MKAILFLQLVLVGCFAVAQNVGIGINTPAAAYNLHLHENVNGDVSFGMTNITTTGANLRGARFRLFDDQLQISNYELSGTIKFATNLNTRLTVAANGNIGIATSTPLALLHVSGNSVLFNATGDIPVSAGNTPINGLGRRMMWYPDKAAFRVGYVASVNWDKDSIGLYSFAAGNNVKSVGSSSTAFGNATKAIGNASVAMGSGSIASGTASVALGIGTSATGEYSTAIGFGSSASNTYATAFGIATIASGTAAMAIGESTTASGTNSTAMGKSTFASGNYATAMGRETNAGANYATAMGYGCTALADNATAMGYYTNAIGQYATAMGNGSIASSTTSTAIGYHTIASYNNAIAMGYYTTASGYNSTAMGSSVTTNGFEGCLIIGDNTGIPATPSICYRANEFRARFDGGYAFYTNAGGSTGVYMVNGANSWASISDSTKKEKFIKTDGEYVLGSIRNMRLGSWNYKSQNPKTFRHYGPMAQEFFKAFGHDALGSIGSDTLISSADIDGVMMISIQALEKRTQKMEDLFHENTTLKQQVASLAELVAKMEKQIALRPGIAGIQPVK